MPSNNVDKIKQKSLKKLIVTLSFVISLFCLANIAQAQTSFDASAGGSIIVGYDSRACGGAGAPAGAIRYNSSSITPAATDYVHYWKMNETTGTTVADSAGSSDGTWQGSANVVSTTGIVGTALQFDGTNNYITIPDAASLEAQNNMTVSMWVQFDASGLGAYQSLLYKDDGVAPWYGWEFALASTKYPYIGLVDTSSNYYDAGGSLVYANQWYHLVATVSGGNAMSFFVNGARNESWNDGTISNPLYTGSNGSLGIGADPSSGNNKFTGVIDDIRIYDRTLSSSEIFDLFLEGLNGGDGGSGCTEYCNGSTWVCPNSGTSTGGGGGSCDTTPTTYDTPGTYTYSVPSGCSSVLVEAYGAGGGGDVGGGGGGSVVERTDTTLLVSAGGGGGGGSSDGGGGGGFASSTVSVSNGEQLKVWVGGGGLGPDGSGGVVGGGTGDFGGSSGTNTGGTSVYGGGGGAGCSSSCSGNAGNSTHGGGGGAKGGSSGGNANGGDSTYGGGGGATSAQNNNPGTSTNGGNGTTSGGGFGGGFGDSVLTGTAGNNSSAGSAANSGPGNGGSGFGANGGDGQVIITPVS